jgi:hypothetical protein
LTSVKVESFAVGIKNDEAGHAPRQADHGQHAALAVEAQRFKRLARDALDTHARLDPRV